MNERLPLPGLRRLAANSAWNCVGQAVPALAALATAPQLVSLLGVERFGMLGILWAVLGYLGIFELGIGRALTQTISERRETRETGDVWVGLMTLAALGLVTALAVGAFAFGCGDRAFHLPPPLAKEVRDSFFGVALAIPFVLLSTGLRGILEAYGQFRALSLVRSTAGSLMFVGPWAVCFLRPSLTSVVGVLVVIRAVTFGVLLWLCLEETTELRDPPRWCAATLSRLAGFGGWVTISQLVGALWGFADRLLLGLLGTPRLVAYYVTPNEVISRCGILSNSLVTAAFPDFARARETPRKSASLFSSAIRWLFWLISPACLLLTATGPEWMRLWLGDEFSRQTTPLLPWLTAYLLVNSFAALPAALLQAHGRPQTFARFQLAELPVVMALLATSIHYMGALGAAIAMFCRLAVETVFLSFRVSRELHSEGPPVTDFLALLGAASASVLAVGTCPGLAERAGLATALCLPLIATSEWCFRRMGNRPTSNAELMDMLEKQNDRRAVDTASPWKSGSPDKADSAAASRVCVE